MKHFFLSIMLFSLGIVNAQRICILDDQFGILYIDNKTKVTIETKYLKPSEFAGMGGVEEFAMENDTIKAVAYNYEDNVNNNLFSALDFAEYPFFIKVKNNGSQITLDPRDSVVFDEKERVIEYYSKSHLENSIGLSRLNYVYKFNYINDTTIMEIVTPPQGNVAITVYYLDKSNNLKMIKEAEADNAITNKAVDFYQLKFKTTIKISYDNLRRRILSIKYYEINTQSRKMNLTKIHQFVYKEGKPIKSYLINAKTKQTEYQQLYKYGIVR